MIAIVEVADAALARAGTPLGEDVETAVVPANVRAMMIEYDRVVRHYEVVE